MNTLAKTLLLLSTILCAIPDAPIGCGAVPTVAASPGAAAVVDVAQATSRLFKRNTNDSLTTNLENFVTALSSVPAEVVRDLATISNFLGLRSRRSLPGISGILSLNPFATLVRTIRSVQNVAEERIGSFLSGLISAGIEFLATKALPWLYETLDTLAKTPNLPGPVRTAIDNFIALYDALQLIGFVGSSATG